MWKSLNRNEGFTLIEHLVSFAGVLTLIHCAVFPLQIIKMERDNIHLALKANHVLAKELQTYIYDSTMPSKGEKKGRYYISEVTEENNELKVCVSWRDMLDREQTQCGFSKR
ncbi:type II secretion system protein [Bacillus sp. HMF5848]|uniref:type II secretion system protein n=1 Tax=Bacillus sp. HMF5848 TaxID=2495421 RepID=UPI000F78F7A8|nr:type II secretion system protein [Bacillus sp. HMF5848]RSK27827.1 type II secretion system protein [Bacillus sp. HMF5848]